MASPSAFDVRAAARNIGRSLLRASGTCCRRPQAGQVVDPEAVCASTIGTPAQESACASAVGPLTQNSGRSRSSAGSPPVDSVMGMAQARVGRLSVESRYHRLPRRLEDDYDLAGGKKQLGTGYNGAVVLARGRRSGAAFAVKSFAMVDVDASDKESFLSEMGIYLSMDHPHVARLMAIYESETEISMVMECCAGGELFDRVMDKKVFTEGEAADATWQMLLAINYLHSEGVVHRDLKLENFLYEQKGSDFLKLIDFGFSKFFQKSTAMNESLGTILYVAPEVLNKNYLGGSCDMWSLGVIVFVLLSGCMPFHGKCDREIIQAIRRGSFNMNTRRWLCVSETAKDFVKRLLVVEPRDRMTAKQALEHPWIAKRRGMKTQTLACCLPGAAPAGAVRDIPEAFLSFARASRFQQACMQLIAWTLPLEERRLLRDAFLKMDTTYTGVLRFHQLDRLLHENYRMPKADRAAVCKALVVLDIDQDGELHYSDFLAVMMAPRLKQRDRRVVEKAFRRLDIEGLGHITQEGLMQTLGEEVSRCELQHTFRMLDVDKDDRIYLEDFVAYLHGALDASAASAKQGPESGAGPALLQASRLSRAGA